jgi:hypothetical protein
MPLDEYLMLVQRAHCADEIKLGFMLAMDALTLPDETPTIVRADIASEADHLGRQLHHEISQMLGG